MNLETEVKYRKLLDKHQKLRQAVKTFIDTQYGLYTERGREVPDGIMLKYEGLEVALFEDAKTDDDYE